MTEYDDTTATETDATDNVEDFDAFWSARKRKHPAVRIFGQVVQLPASLPLQFELEARRLQRSKRDKDVRKLVAILFGQDQYERWAEAGMDLEQFQVLLAWAPRRIAGQLGEDGKPLSIAQVAAEVAERNTTLDEAEDAEDGEADPS